MIIDPRHVMLLGDIMTFKVNYNWCCAKINESIVFNKSIFHLNIRVKYWGFIGSVFQI